MKVVNYIIIGLAPVMEMKRGYMRHINCVRDSRRGKPDGLHSSSQNRSLIARGGVLR